MSYHGFSKTAAIVILAATLGCKTSDDLLLDPSLSVNSASSIDVLDWNLYVGTDLTAVVQALLSQDPTDDLPALLNGIATLQETAFPVRAEAIADAIARAKPQVVGLQEASDIDIDLTPLGLPVKVDLDFLAILQAALASRGLDYQVGASVQNFSATPFPGISLLDHDVLLVDPERVNLVAADGRNYAANIGMVAPGVNLIRGWVAVTAEVDGSIVTFVNTHLEVGEGTPLSLLRAAQATELMAVVGTATPVVVMGDFNDPPSSLMHQVVTGAGFTDVWSEFHPGVEGLTCCHLPDLSDKVARFDQRIDYLFARGLGHPRAGLQGSMKLLGAHPADHVSGSSHTLWPSDHAGLIGSLLRVPAVGVPVVP
jgi:Endonuclease/Exonuclease/phosphatase family